MRDLAEAAWATWVLMLVAVVLSAAAMGIVAWIFDRFGERK